MDVLLGELLRDTFYLVVFFDDLIVEQKKTNEGSLQRFKSWSHVMVVFGRV